MSGVSLATLLARFGLALAAAALAWGAAFAQQHPWRVQITFDPHTDFMPAAINDRGVLAGNALGSYGVHAAVKRGGHVRDLGFGEAVAINNRGQAVGSAFDTGSQVAAMWGPTRRVTLETEGVASMANDINDHGQVVGTTIDGPNGPRHVSLWHRGKVTYLGLGFGQGINNEGAVVGAFYDNSRPPRAALWQGGQMTFLGRDTIYVDSFAYAINDAGQVVGSEGGSAVVWHGGATVYLDLGSRASDINAGGDIVGYRSGSTAIEQRATLWRGDDAWREAIDLNTLLRPGPAGAGWVLTNAGRVNRDGEIVGTALNRVLCQQEVTCVSHAFVLERSALPDEYPVPTPP